MDISADLTASCDRSQLFGWVDDLGRYPQWMRLVHRAEEVDPDDDGSRCWTVELRARVGPFARSKRLRMVRSECVSDSRVIFERRESDGRRHSPWVLRVSIVPVIEPRSAYRLDMNLHYGGGLWTGGVLEKVLSDEIDRGRDRLLSLVSTTP